MKERLKYLDPDFYIDLITNRVHKKSKEVKWKIFDLGISLLIYLIYAYLIYFVIGIILQTSTPIVIVTSDSMEPMIYRGDIIFIQGVSADALNSPRVDMTQSVDQKYVREFATLEYENDGTCSIKVSSTGGKYIDCPTLESFTIMNGVSSPTKVNITEDKEIVVYTDDVSGEDIIHRAQVKMYAPDGVYLITKGDNKNTNPTIDQDCNFYNILGESKLLCSLNPYPISMDKIRGKYLFKIPYLGYLKLWLFGK